MVNYPILCFIESNPHRHWARATRLFIAAQCGSNEGKPVGRSFSLPNHLMTVPRNRRKWKEKIDRTNEASGQNVAVSLEQSIARSLDRSIIQSSNLQTLLLDIEQS
jgi:hypothetical protein